MYREKIDELLKWKMSTNRMPLILRGARQVGKTWLMKEFGEKYYKKVAYINFENNEPMKVLFEGSLEPERIINALKIESNIDINADDTLIIFDEIQEYPDIATTLKAFRQDGRFDVICSGSMLGINYKKIHSNSVGNKTDYEMFSMDFEEFLLAKGYRGEQIDNILKHMIKREPFSETELNVYKTLFLDYCVLGGMPEVVRGYIETGTFSGSLEIQRQIRMDYEEDVRKYAEGLDQAKIMSVYRSVPAQLAKENKKFQFSKIEKNARSREYTGCIEWLIDAGVITECNCLIFPELPLKGNIDESKYKLYYPDTGLLISALDEEALI